MKKKYLSLSPTWRRIRVYVPIKVFLYGIRHDHYHRHNCWKVVQDEELCVASVVIR